jgi:hypothetical protein
VTQGFTGTRSLVMTWENEKVSKDCVGDTYRKLVVVKRYPKRVVGRSVDDTQPVFLALDQSKCSGIGTLISVDVRSVDDNSIGRRWWSPRLKTRVCQKAHLPGSLVVPVANYVRS